MENLKELFHQDTFLLFNEDRQKSKSPYTPFAYTDLFSTFAGQNNQPIIHFWSMKKHVILGMKDTRLPYLQEAVTVLKSYDYTPIVRNSGGLAVVSDSGILNVSLIIPKEGTVALTIPEAYQLMTDWITQAFPEKKISAKEVRNSYCPGEYDLSIDGKKFAGISQRRIKQGIAIMIYLSINGDQNARGAMVRDFYKAGLKDGFGQNGYPPVEPNSMANLATLLSQDLTPATVKERLLQTMTAANNVTINQTFLPHYMNEPTFQENLAPQLDKMILRNQVIDF